MPPKVMPATVEQKPKVSEEGLKVGQSVVLMVRLPLTCTLRLFQEVQAFPKDSSYSSRWILSGRSEVAEFLNHIWEILISPAACYVYLCHVPYYPFVIATLITPSSLFSKRR